MTTTSKSTTTADQILNAAHEIADIIEKKDRMIRQLQTMNKSMNDEVVRLDREVTELRDVAGRGPLGKDHPAYQALISEA